MHSWFLAAAAIFLVTLVAVTAHAAGALPSPGEYALDAKGSAVAFNVNNFVVSSVDGKFNTFTGKVTVGDSLATTQVEASAEVKSIDTGNSSRDEHLRTPDYFDAAKFPLMTFKSTAVWGTPQSFGMKGNLTIKGITHEVVWSGRIEDSGIIHTETKIDRKNFGLTSGASIGDEVRLKLLIHLVKSPPATPQ